MSLIVGGAGSTLVPAAKDFLKAASAPITAEVSATIDDMFSLRRERRIERAALRAAEKVRDAGRTVVSVPDRTLVPLLEGAAREDDAALTELWASLLATASASGGPEVSPYFPTILGRLTPFDAHVLRAIIDAEEHRDRSKLDWSERQGVAIVDQRDIWGRLNEVWPEATSDAMELSLEMLAAWGLLELNGVLEKLPRELVLGQGTVVLSMLGRRFIRACQGPTAAAAP